MKKILFLFAFLFSLNIYAQKVVVQYTTVTSGTVTGNDTGQNVQIIQDGTLAVSLTIAFPATPVNGQIFGVTSVGGITTVSMTSTVGTIINALTTMASGGTVRYQFLTAQNKWYKIN